MSIKIIIPKCLARNPSENIVIEVPRSLIQTSGYLIVRRQGKKLVTQQLPDYWGHDLSSARNASHIPFADCGSFNCGIPSSSEKEKIHRSYSPAKRFARNAARNFYQKGMTDQTYSQGESSAFHGAKVSHLRQPQNSMKSSRLSTEENCPCTPELTVDSSIFDSNASYGNFPSDLTSCFRDLPKDRTFIRPQTANATKNATPNQIFTISRQTMPKGMSYLRSPGFHESNQTFSRASGRQSCSRYTHDDKSHRARLHPCASKCKESMFALEDSSMDITTDIAQFPNQQTACGLRPVTQPPLNRTVLRPANQTFLVNSPRSLIGSPQTFPSAASRPGRSRPGHDTFSRSANRSQFIGSYSSGSRPYDSGNKDISSIPYLAPDQFYEEKYRPYDSSVQRTRSSLQDSSDYMMFAFGGPMNMSQEGKYNVIKHMSELFSEGSKLDDCSCTPKHFESIGSYITTDI